MEPVRNAKVKLANSCSGMDLATWKEFHVPYPHSIFCSCPGIGSRKIENTSIERRKRNQPDNGNKF